MNKTEYHEMPAGDLQVSRMLVFTSPYGEGSDIPRRFKVYERKLQYNPGIASELYESIVSALPPGMSSIPDEDSMEIIPSSEWHPDMFGTDTSEDHIREAVSAYLQTGETGSAIQSGCLMQIESEACLVFCAFM
jgi:hypothetical protein